ncbi:replication initiation protein [Commensalibacter sp. TBRC 16381]|uniref:Replication initiation protein n=1 Tax=Commensalibacter oyaizuii TaxID=3043873 RepID=A0ABT6Q2J1_9PROT|nr:replication initiation protein [Commensalibacter sp. TBRC 16381]MDI2091314.1 replication initiation protein [Commensalibacter sp. TBRC 16381]
MLQEAVDKLAERWIQEGAKYFNGEGKVKIVFSDSIMPYFTQLKGQFTSIILKNISSLKSSYSIRVYELLRQFKIIGSRTITVTKLRSILEVEDKYKTFKSFNQWVIQPSIKELNEKSNLTMITQTIKVGRNVKSLQFDFKEICDKAINMCKI